MLEEAINKYQNRATEAAEVIEELIKLAKKMREAQMRGENQGLDDDEIAFYDALEVNDSAVEVLGDDTLKLIAQELVKSLKRSVSFDWTKRENARAQIRVLVKRVLLIPNADFLSNQFQGAGGFFTRLCRSLGQNFAQVTRVPAQLFPFFPGFSEIFPENAGQFLFDSAVSSAPIDIQVMNLGQTIFSGKQLEYVIQVAFIRIFHRFHRG
ncbi:MAG: DUF3387 domain-containing protein [Desulfobulbaceae bacterium]|nr:DUF3387 domain-containing protein [Desulfobulbaceae bacterium]